MNVGDTVFVRQHSGAIQRATVTGVGKGGKLAVRVHLPNGAETSYSALPGGTDPRKTAAKEGAEFWFARAEDADMSDLDASVSVDPPVVEPAAAEPVHANGD